MGVDLPHAAESGTGHRPQLRRPQCAVTVTVGAGTRRYGRGGPGLCLLRHRRVLWRWPIECWRQRRDAEGKGRGGELLDRGRGASMESVVAVTADGRPGFFIALNSFQMRIIRS